MGPCVSPPLAAVRSAPGEGSCFWIDLSTFEPPRAAPRRVLYIEDNELNRKIVRDLQEHDVRVMVRYRSKSKPDPAGVPPGSRYLDQWLAEHFAPLETHGRYAIWMRR